MGDLSLDITSVAQQALDSTGGRSLAVSPAQALAERLCREMTDAWRRGERPLAESYLERHPDLRADPDAALRLIYEEICLRQEQEPGSSSRGVVRRFPQWQEELRGLLDCHDLLQPQTAAPAFPAVGEILGEFRLTAELGRGGLGRVFLALQCTLADRPVVLKMTPRSGEEHLALARLQHTSIVPLYTAQDFPERNLRVLCMPYLGGTSLAQILSALAAVPPRERSGPLVLEQLDGAAGAVGIALPRQEKGRERLASASYEQALVHVGQRLARALQYAHERGVIHLDLKPSNVLVAADGEPMLLDFHLARRPVEAGADAPEWLGGTPGYMSPEQQAALDAVSAGLPVPAAVTGRSDVYSLGVLLYEALGGELPAAGAGFAPLRLRNPNVSVGLDDILARCLATDPARRYPDAAALAADLRCHLEDRPLRGVANRSLHERWRKWRRRRPHALAATAGVVILMAALLGAGGLFLRDAAQRRDDAQRAFYVGSEQMYDKQYAQAARTFQDGLERLGALPGSERLRQSLRHDMLQAQRADGVKQLHELAEKLRYLAVIDSWSVRDRRIHAAGCDYVWKQRGLLTDGSGTPVGRELEENIAPDLTDLVLIGSDLRVGLASPEEILAVRRQVLDDLDELRALIGTGHVLARARQDQLERLGRSGEAREAAEEASRLAPQSAWDYCALGRMLLGRGDMDAAERKLRRAAALQPSAFWPCFYGGVCAYRQGRHAEALRAFDRSVGAAPASGECHYYLGLVSAALGRTDEALREYDAATAARPAPGAAFLERGRLHAQQGRPAEALADFRRAADRGADPAAAYYLMARVQVDRKQLAEARVSLRRALQHRPDYEEARRLLADLPGP